MTIKFTDWKDKIGDFAVERKEIKRAQGKPYFLNTRTHIGVLHTTEGSSVSGAWSTLNKHHSAPHFIIGEGRIVQCRPLDAQAAALVGGFANAHADIQIELVGWTGGGKAPKGNDVMRSWLPVDDVLLPLIDVMVYVVGNGYDIPLQRPVPHWQDDCSDIRTIWASNNTRRKENIFPSFPGWYGHLEIPNQAKGWHYDPGALQWSKLLEMALQRGKSLYDAPETYIVEAGDGFYKIARKLGIHVGYLLQANKMKMDDLLTPGQVLIVPQR